MERTRGGAETGRILLIADDPQTAEFVGKGLGSDGHEVVVAEDAEIAAFLAGTEDYDLIVLEVSLQSDRTRDLLKKRPGAFDGAPVIVLSEHGDADARRAWEEAGAFVFVPSPLDLPGLRACVNEQLARQTVSDESGAMKSIIR